MTDVWKSWHGAPAAPRVRSLLATVAVAAMGGGVLSVQAADVSPSATGRPDFTGVWEAGDAYTLRTDPSDGKPIPFQPWALEVAKKERADDRAGKPQSNNNQKCLPPGFIRQYKGNFPFQVVQTSDQLTFLFEENTRFNIVYLNAQHPRDLKPSWYGHAVGRWEGDTLVIDTVGTSGRTPLSGGTSLTEAVHYTHRVRLIDDGKKLEDVVTIDDPKAFTRPWQMRTEFERHEPGFRLREYVCAENNQDLWND